MNPAQRRGDRERRRRRRGRQPRLRRHDDLLHQGREDDRLEDVKFKTFGCGAAIAVSSMVSEMAKGKTLDEALQDQPRRTSPRSSEGCPRTRCTARTWEPTPCTRRSRTTGARRKQRKRRASMDEPREEKAETMRVPLLRCEIEEPAVLCASLQARS